MKPGGVYADPIRFVQFLSTNGDGTGVINAVGDYTTPEIFYIKPTNDEVIEIDRLVIHILDSGTLPVGEYGGLGSALTNGIDIQVTNARSISRSILPSVIKSNVGLLHLTDLGFSLVSFTGGIESITAVFDCKNGRGRCLILDGSQDHKLEILLSDNFTGLVDHHFIAHGFK